MDEEENVRQDMEGLDGLSKVLSSMRGVSEIA